MTTATARAKSKVTHCILEAVVLPLTIEEHRIVAEYPEVFSVDKPGRIALPIRDAQELGLWRFLSR
jgi:hypothetical protein